MKDLNKNTITARDFYEILQRAKLILEEIKYLEQKEFLKNILAVVTLPKNINFLVGTDDEEANYIFKALAYYQDNKADNDIMEHKNATTWFSAVTHLLNIYEFMEYKFRRTKGMFDLSVKPIFDYSSNHAISANEEIKNRLTKNIIMTIVYAKYGIVMHDLPSQDLYEAQDDLFQIVKLLETSIKTDKDSKSDIFFNEKYKLYKEEIIELNEYLKYLISICDLRIFINIKKEYPYSLSAELLMELAKLKDKKTITNTKELKKHYVDYGGKQNQLRYDVDEGLDWLKNDSRHNPFIFYKNLPHYDSELDYKLPSNKEDLQAFIQKAEERLKSKEVYALKANFNLDRLSAPLNRKRLEWLGIDGRSIEEILKPNNPYHDSPRSKNPIVHLKWDVEHGRVEKKLRADFQNVEFDIEEFNSISTQEK